MSADDIIAFKDVVAVLVISAMIIVLIFGAINLIRYFRTREKSYLTIGLICTLLVPGLIFCALVTYVVPYAFITYAPPPSNYVP
jgi:amino acid transporter